MGVLQIQSWNCCLVAICNCIVLRDVEQPQDHPALKECLLTLIFRSTDLDSCFWTSVFKRSFLRPSVNSKKIFMSVCYVASVVSDSLQPYGLQPSRLLCPWDSLGNNTGVGCHALLQGLFPTQGSNPCLLGVLHWQQVLYHQHHLGSPVQLNSLFCLSRSQIGWAGTFKSQLKYFQGMFFL